MGPCVPTERMQTGRLQISERHCAGMKILLIASLVNVALQACPCAADDGDDHDTVLGVVQFTLTSTSYVTLILWALLLSLVGWIAVLYPFVFCPKFDATVRDYTSRGVKCPGKILSVRKGRVFNPLRYCLPTRYNCYVTVEYSGRKKELAVDESVMKRLSERDSDSIDVYMLPEYPQSGILDEQYQGHEVTTDSKVMYALAAILLLGLGAWTSLVSTADEITDSPGEWKVWIILLGHLAAFGVAYSACNFVHSIRVEALLFGSADDDGLQEYADTHHLANRGCSRSVMELKETRSVGTTTTALADSKDEVSDTNDVEEAKAYQALT
uniref:Uncharacterized protein n=1 Tax=Trieres chinensis TaxID=1514140 RepID=A0A7S1Z3W0_TRICV|mmetsp:Transcript_17050/g.34989  ORF Transcript_17050/g.34989 Transcript_17050/m.34989 type:complete len:326 (+) Transcript_17050:148-1125(+)